MAVSQFWRLLGSALADVKGLPPAIWDTIALLLDLGGVEESQGVESSCLYLDGQGETVLAVNPEFVRRFVKEPGDALFLFLHELSHHARRDLLEEAVLNGDPYERYVFNVAADMMINRALEGRYFPEGAGLLDRVYPLTSFPEVLLGSFRSLEEKAGSLSFEALSIFFREMGVERPNLAAESYLLSFDPRNASRLVQNLKALLPKGDERLFNCFLPFLGEHGARSLERGDLPFEVEGTCDSLRGILAGGRFEDRDLQISPVNQYDSSEAGKLVRAIELAITEGVEPYRSRRAVYAERTVIPSPSRRPLFFLAAGYSPVFYETTLVGHGVRDDGVYLYLDVSGSVMEELPFLYGLLGAIRDELACDRVFLFSADVREVMVEEFLKGRVETSFGTDYDCVVEHARRNSARRMLVITDGLGELSEPNREWLNRAGVLLFLVLVDIFSGVVSPLEEVAERVWRLKTSPF